ncbi:FG-GAP repeat domain-containing protein [Luteimonas saliphila]|uniref:FG-GAP repeat domain-containing protein n=1 Tax=Luteimonas saliphila TaxID=2804919 RepID=UPI00192E1999|nr:VCBS repeat-containing protein [Luteimonas saliphila]
MNSRPGTARAVVSAGIGLSLLALAWLAMLPAAPGHAQDASPPAPVTLDEALGLVNRYCGACHAVPPPNLMPKRDWPAAVQTMAELSEKMRGQTFIPAEVLPHIKAFYYGSAPAELPRLPYLAPAPSPLRFRASILGAPAQVPLVTHVAPGLTVAPTDLLVSDAGRREVLRLWREDGQWRERALAELVAPAHAQVVDLDGDGRLDVVVAELGEMAPSGKPVGKVVVLLGEPSGTFLPRTLAEGLGRVTDVRAADLDGDGDIDLAVAVFGMNDIGGILWLENRDGALYRHNLTSLAGALGIDAVDLDGDGRLDLVSLIAQEHEVVMAFRNLGGGAFEATELARAPHPMFGSTSLRPVDLDQDGDIDLLFTNGDAFDLQTDPKPYHGVQWLENLGGMRFAFRDIGRFYGAVATAVGDLDGDGDLDVVASSWINYWRDPGRHTLVWYENDGEQNFTAHGIASEPAGLTSLRLADINGDGRPDIVAGAFRMDLLQELLGMSVNEDTRPAPPPGSARDHPRLLLFENLPVDGRGDAN